MATQSRIGWRPYVTQVVNAVDADATAFIAAAGITNLTQAAAISTLVNDLKTYGLWTKMKALYPFVGGSATSHKFNLKDPRDLDAAYRLVFNGGWIHSSNGALPNGTTGYADTKFVSNSVFTTANDTHISIYSLSDTPSGNKSNGAYQMSNVQDFALTERNLSGNYSAAIGSEVNPPNDCISVPVTDSKGYYLLNRSSSTTLKGYKNGNLLQTKSTTSTNNQLSQRNYYISAINADHTSGATWFNDKMNAFHSIGFSLTETEASNLYTSVQKFQTTLGRHVGTPYVSDPDAIAFLMAAGITDGTQAAAINTLVIRMKADGVWTKMKAVYPFVGGTSTSHKFNLKDPRDLDAAYRLVFSGGGTHTSTGYLGNGSNSYARTYMIHNTLQQNNTHVSFYNRYNSTNNFNNFIGCIDYPGTMNGIGIYPISQNTFIMLVNSRESFDPHAYTGHTSVNKFWMINRNNSTQEKVFINGVLKVTFSKSSQLGTSKEIYLGSINGYGNAGINEATFVTIGDGLTDEEATNLYSTVQAFQTTLGRQVNVPLVSDTDAQTFLNAANITSFQQASAVNKLVVDLKAAGVWTKMKAIYPFVGGSATSHKWNLKDPRDLDAAYRLVFNGGWTHTGTGALPNGTTGYANTYFNLQSLKQNDTHLSIYNTNNFTPISNGSIDMGAYQESGPNTSGAFIATEIATNLSRARLFFNALDYTATDNRGYYIVNSNSTNNQYFINNVSRSSIANSGFFPLINKNIFIGALNGTSFLDGAYYYSNGLYTFSSIGDGLTDTEATSLYTAVQTYQTSLGRAVNTPVYNNSLVLNLDAGNANSYPGTGTTWFDLASGNNGTLVNGPTYDTINGGSLLFDGINDYVDLGSNFKFVDKDLTLDFWIKCTDNSLSNWHDIIVMATPDQSSAIGLFKSRSGNSANGSIQFSFIGNHLYSTLIGTQIVSVGIINLTGVIKKESGLYKLYLYVNGVLDKSLNTTISTYDMNTFTNFFARIGSGGPTYPEIWQGNIYSGKVWSRALTATEILSNFNSTRGRFGL